MSGFRRQVYEAGDCVSVAGAVTLAPAILSFFVSGDAYEDGNVKLFEAAGDIGVWFGGLGLLLLVIGQAMLWAGREEQN